MLTDRPTGCRLVVLTIETHRTLANTPSSVQVLKGEIFEQSTGRENFSRAQDENQ